MIQTRTCPNADRWQALLAEAAGTDSAELEAHLAGCARCRGVLDELAVGSSGWLRDAGRLAADTDDDDPELTRSVHRIYDVVTDANPDIPLDFLNPCGIPGTIGMLGRYQVLAVLGRGATGIVFGRRPDLLRPVAIKVMIPYCTNGTARHGSSARPGAAASATTTSSRFTRSISRMGCSSGHGVRRRVAPGPPDADGRSPREVARIGLQAANGRQRPTRSGSFTGT